MLGRTSILRWLNIGLVLFYLIGVHSVALAQQGAIEEAEALNQQVVDLYQQGRYEEAIPAAERALAIREEVLGPEHPGSAASPVSSEGILLELRIPSLS